MYEPFHKLKFYGAASYVDQVRAGINYFVKKKGKKAAVRDVPGHRLRQGSAGRRRAADREAEASRSSRRWRTSRPTRTSPRRSPSCKAAGCDLSCMGTIVRDSIVPYTTARKMGWTDVDFLGSAAVYDLFVGAAQGDVTRASTRMGLTEMPYRDTLAWPRSRRSFDDYKEATRSIPTSARSTATSPPTSPCQGLKNAGKDLTLDSFVKGLEVDQGLQGHLQRPGGHLRPEQAPGRQLVVPGRGQGRHAGSA